MSPVARAVAEPLLVRQRVAGLMCPMRLVCRMWADAGLAESRRQRHVAHHQKVVHARAMTEIRRLLAAAAGDVQTVVGAFPRRVVDLATAFQDQPPGLRRYMQLWMAKDASVGSRVWKALSVLSTILRDQWVVPVVRVELPVVDGVAEIHDMLGCMVVYAIETPVGTAVRVTADAEWEHAVLYGTVNRRRPLMRVRGLRVTTAAVAVTVEIGEIFHFSQLLGWSPGLGTGRPTAELNWRFQA
jgi:hypothetical protein